MKRGITTVFAGGLLALTLFSVAAAGPFEDGETAYRSGDYVAAMSYWRPLADQGSVIAQVNLGVMYTKGQGAPQDYGQALVWYRKAADQGYAAAQFNLGVMYAEGQGGCRGTTRRPSSGSARRPIRAMPPRNSTSA